LRNWQDAALVMSLGSEAEIEHRSVPFQQGAWKSQAKMTVDSSELL